MKRRDLPFQDWGKRAIAEGRKTLTSRCSGLEAVNHSPDDWELLRIVGDGVAEFRHKTRAKIVVCRCPWQVGVDYSGVTVTGIAAKRVQDMTLAEVEAEGLLADGKDNENTRLFDEAERINSVGGSCGCRIPELYPFKVKWDSIHRRDVNNRFSRNPWTWRLSIKPTQQGSKR